MPTYISLMSMTDQGVKRVHEAPGNIKKAVEAMEAAGGRLLGFYVTMGDYDFVAITECPDDETSMALAMALGSIGDVRTNTMRAFTSEQMAGLLQKTEKLY